MQLFFLTVFIFTFLFYYPYTSKEFYFLSLFISIIYLIKYDLTYNRDTEEIALLPNWRKQLLKILSLLNIPLIMIILEYGLYKMESEVVRDFILFSIYWQLFFYFLLLFFSFHFFKSNSKRSLIIINIINITSISFALFLNLILFTGKVHIT